MNTCLVWFVEGQSDAFLWDGKMHDLGTVNGSTCTYAFSVNAQKQVVGNDCGGAFAFLWEEGGPMVDLSTLIINPSTAYAFLVVITINDRGEIAGMAGDTVDVSRAVVLIPCDENHPNIEGCDYSMVDSAISEEVHTAGSAKTAAVLPSQPKFSPAQATLRYRSFATGQSRRSGALPTN
jgi:uncharacterized membrane protein